MTDATGREWLGRYRIQRLLKSREGSETYLAADESGRAVVLRISRRAEEIEREAATLARLHNAGIPQLIEHGREGEDGFVLVKQLAVGDTLAERVRAGALSAEEVAQIGAGIAEILSYLHAQSPPILHRDLEPSNVVLGVGGAVSLIDFGAAGDPTSGIAGTIGYMAPEQVTGVAGPAADLYGLGATLLFALTGREPTALPREGLRPAVEKILPESALREIIAALLEPDPRHRPQAAQEVAQRLRRFAEAEATGAPSWAEKLAAGWGEMAARATPDASPELHREVLARWTELLGTWRNERAHEGFVTWSATHEMLPVAGQFYRTVLEASPGDPLAQRGRSRVLAQAQALLQVATASGPDWKRISVYVRAATIMVLLAAIAFVLYLALH
jgi:hypothetical protein